MASSPGYIGSFQIFQGTGMVEFFAVASGMLALWWLAAWVACALFSGHLAEQKGRCTACWLLWGLLFGPLALLAAAGLPDRSRKLGEPHPQTHVTCPECVGFVPKSATICQHCGTRLAPAGSQTLGGASASDRQGGDWREKASSPWFKAAIITALIVLAGIVFINRSNDVTVPPPPPSATPQ